MDDTPVKVQSFIDSKAATHGVEAGDEPVVTAPGGTVPKVDIMAALEASISEAKAAKAPAKKQAARKKAAAKKAVAK